MQEVLTILLRHIEENRVLYQKIYNANKEGELIPIIRKGLIQILQDKVLAAEEQGYRLKIPAPIFTSLTADLYFDIVTCYIEHADQFSAEVFIDSICQFTKKDFFFAPNQNTLSQP